MMASNISLPLFPRISVATAANLIVASSSTFCSRFTGFGPFLHEGLAEAHQLAQFSNGLGGKKTGLKQAMAKQREQSIHYLSHRSFFPAPPSYDED
jgi:hypothetical protein